MPYKRNVDVKTGARHSGTVFLRVLGTDTGDSTPSVLLEFGQRRFLFNAGGGLQRFCTEHQVRVKKVGDVYLTHISSDTMAGLPGMMLTLADMHDDTKKGAGLGRRSPPPGAAGKMAIGGPRGLVDFMRALRTFFKRPNFMMHLREWHVPGLGAPVKDRTTGLTISPILLRRPATGGGAAVAAPPPRSPPAWPAQRGGGFRARRPSPGPLTPGVHRLGFVTLNVEHMGAASTSKSTAGAAPAPAPVSAPSLGGGMVCCYVCKLPGVKGKFFPDKAIKLGVRPGPAFGLLSNGVAVTTQDGRVVQPHECCTPPSPGPVVMILCCPNKSWIPALVQQPAFATYFAARRTDDGDLSDGKKDAKVKAAPVACIVHMSPGEVVSDPRYEAFVRRFNPLAAQTEGAGPRHLMMNRESCEQHFVFHSSMRCAAQLHAVNPDVFPVLYPRPRRQEEDAEVKALPEPKAGVAGEGEGEGEGGGAAATGEEEAQVASSMVVEPGTTSDAKDATDGHLIVKRAAASAAEKAKLKHAAALKNNTLHTLQARLCAGKSEGKGEGKGEGALQCECYRAASLMSVKLLPLRSSGVDFTKIMKLEKQHRRHWKRRRRKKKETKSASASSIAPTRLPPSEPEAAATSTTTATTTASSSSPSADVFVVDDEDLLVQVRQQLLFYFSDDNWRQDAFLRLAAASDAHGCVPISTLLSFNKLKALTTDPAVVAEAATADAGAGAGGSAPAIVLSADKRGIKRACEGGADADADAVAGDTMPCVLYVDGFPRDGSCRWTQIRDMMLAAVRGGGHPGASLDGVGAQVQVQVRFVTMRRDPQTRHFIGSALVTFNSAAAVDAVCAAHATRPLFFQGRALGTVLPFPAFLARTRAEAAVRREQPQQAEELARLRAAAAATSPTVSAAARAAPAPRTYATPEQLVQGPPGDVQLTFLGTSSAIPSKYRNVTGIYLRFGAQFRDQRLPSAGSGGDVSGGREAVNGTVGMLLDAGEGTYGQLRRVFGDGDGDAAAGGKDKDKDKDEDFSLESVLRSLGIVWISHMHADHHLGLIRILRQRAVLLHRLFPEAFTATKPKPPTPPAATDWRTPRPSAALADAIAAKPKSVPPPPVLVIGPPALCEWLCRMARLEDEAGVGELRPANSSPHGYDARSLARSPLHCTFAPTTACMQPSHPWAERLARSCGIALSNVPVQHCRDSFGVILQRAEDVFRPQQQQQQRRQQHHPRAVGGRRTPPLSPPRCQWKLVYSGDCRPSQALVRAGRGATLLIHEATFADGLEDDAYRKRHSTVSEAVSVGEQMGAYRILLTHFSARYPKIVSFADNSNEAEAMATDPESDAALSPPPPFAAGRGAGLSPPPMLPYGHGGRGRGPPLFPGAVSPTFPPHHGRGGAMATTSVLERYKGRFCVTCDFMSMRFSALPTIPELLPLLQGVFAAHERQDELLEAQQAAAEAGKGTQAAQQNSNAGGIQQERELFGKRKRRNNGDDHRTSPSPGGKTKKSKTGAGGAGIGMLLEDKGGGEGNGEAAAVAAAENGRREEAENISTMIGPPAAI